jgi:hypothetical protein
VPDPKHELRILKDAAGQKLADKMFDRYKGNLSNKAAFHIALDRLLSEMACRPFEEEGEDDAPEDDYDEDEDLHADDAAGEETASVDVVKEALKRVLARSGEKK